MVTTASVWGRTWGRDSVTQNAIDSRTIAILKTLWSPLVSVLCLVSVVMCV